MPLLSFYNIFSTLLLIKSQQNARDYRAAKIARTLIQRPPAIKSKFDRVAVEDDRAVVRDPG